MRSILILTLLLSVIGCNKNNRESSSSQPAPGSSPSKNEPGASSVTDKSAVAEKKAEEWTRSEEADKMDGHKTVHFKLRSSNKIRFSDAEGPPSIEVSCGDGVDIYLWSGPVSTPNVRYKVDESAPVRDRWYGGTLFLSSSLPRDLLRQMMRAKTLKIEFTPAASYTQIASFDLGNLKEVIQREKACRFQKKARGF